jgi:hypothetical protein
MLVFGQINAFRRAEAHSLLERAHDALDPGGTLVLEVHESEAIERFGCSPPGWATAREGLFAEGPYLLLHEAHFEPESKAAAKRYFVIDESAAVQCYSETLQGYSHDEYVRLLEGVGFESVETAASLIGKPDPELPDFRALWTRR